jgi:hypothetical protein
LSIPRDVAGAFERDLTRLPINLIHSNPALSRIDDRQQEWLALGARQVGYYATIRGEH